MFTGIVENVGFVQSVTPNAGGLRLAIEAGPVSEGTAAGASLAVNGVCLTVADAAASCLTFDVIAETLRRTNLGALRVGSVVNLERSLRAGDRVDGHFVQGHVDGRATVVATETRGGEWLVRLQPEPHLRPGVIPKGSIALDGVSLTIAGVDGARFTVALIPTTLRRTTLAGWQVGSEVNVETDILARTVVHALSRMTDRVQNRERERALAGPRPSGNPTATITFEFLKAHGYL
ncbi:MAG TPA: riboflavin synthase [Phycisphaerae bacterium]|jgi:riboflavin synthase